MPFNQLTPYPGDGEIINNLLGGGIERKKAEEQLFSQYAYFIAQSMSKYSFSEDESFSIYTDTIMAAITMIHNRSFEGRSSLKTWLYQIFHNKCVDLVRKKATNKNSVHRVLTVPDLLLQMTDTAKTVVQQMMEKADKDRLQQMLKQIGENCRQMLLQWADGFSDKEIAAALQYKTADVVKTSRLRCLDKLRQLYKTDKKREIG